MKTKTQRILEYIKANQPCKAGDICKGVGLERRTLELDDKYPVSWQSHRPYTYWVGWSGFRVNLTAGYGYSHNPAKAAIKLTDAGYVLTKYGEKKLAKY